jgi:hypothetical protein
MGEEEIEDLNEEQLNFIPQKDEEVEEEEIEKELEEKVEEV